MLFLVGMGLVVKDISLRAIEVCKECELFIDRYTSFVDDKHIDLIKGLTGKQVKELGRKELEENAKAVVSRARSANIAVLVGGDPLMATTHKTLFIEAKRQGVNIEVVHSASIVSAAIGESGLDFYRFGQISTVPEWSEHYTPVSFYEVIKRNAMNNLHSLLLLDYDQESRTSLNIKEAVDILEKAEESYKSGIIRDDTKIVILNSVSSGRTKNIFTNIARARGLRLNGPSVMIIPAGLTDIEKESVTSMCKVVE